MSQTVYISSSAINTPYGLIEIKKRADKSISKKAKVSTLIDEEKFNGKSDYFNRPDFEIIFPDQNIRHIN